MSRTLFALSIFCTLSTVVLCPQTISAESLILENARIYTVDKSKPWADTLAVDENGKISAVGTSNEVKAQIKGNPIVIDLKGKMVLPGFQDVHLHPVEAGVNEILCVFEPFDTIKNLEFTVLDCIDESEPGEWVLGSGINMAYLLERHDNPVEILDKISPHRPVLILDDLGHGAWTNSVGLKAAGYHDIQDDPAGGIIIRNKKTGKPNGVVLENAQQKLRNLAFPPTAKNIDFAYESLLKALKILAKNGITSVSDAGGYWPQGHHNAWIRAESEGSLTVRASNAMYIYPDIALDKQLAQLKSLYSNDANALVRFNQAKIYVDGILSQATGALLSPYSAGLRLSKDEQYGFLYFEEKKLKRAAKVLSELGFQLHFHVTGDYGARLALDAIENATQKSGPHRLTHLYLVDQKDFDRFTELDVVADFQLAPSSLSSDYLSFIKTFIGKRSKTMLPAGSIHDAGALVTLSSDWDADKLSPLVKIKTAVGRKNNGVPDVETAIRMLTINPAQALQQADRTGSIEVGKFADLVVLDKNIMEIPLEQISETKVISTLFQGSIIYDPMNLFENAR
ncbi:MAG: amidohydrolase [Hyphomicrobiales bacterium]|nr:amidohydrolase [Hyphomicrobiales bacterium]